MIADDTVLFGALTLMLGAVFYTSSSPHPFWRRFYGVVPALVLCYFLPALANTVGLIDTSESQLYFVASRYLLPACLVLLTLSVDLPAILRLGPKALVMFLTGTVGVILGGPLAILLFRIVSPETVGGEGADAVWRGMTTIAGSWIGGGANQTAMKEVFEVGNDLFAQMIAVDVLMINLWLPVLFFIANRAERIDARIGADTSAIDAVRERVSRYQAEHARTPDLRDLMLILAVAFGLTSLGHALAGYLAPWFAGFAWAERLSLASSFFWLVVIATTAGLLLSFTRVRTLEGAGASKVGSALLYVLIATIGMQMDIRTVVEAPGLFAVGFIWLATHALLLFVVARLIRAPMFYLAVGSQANIGGAASAPVVASAFHPALAPVGVLLAVLGYVLGTYGAWLCGQLMRVAAGE